MKLGQIIKSSLLTLAVAASVASAANYELVSQGATATATTTESYDLSTSNLFDGNTGTRWASEFLANQEVVIDLGSRKYIDKISLNWEAAFATQFKIQVSNDAINWDANRRTKYVTGTQAGIQEIVGDFSKHRYIKLLLEERALPAYGFSLYEVEVFTDNDLHHKAKSVDLFQFSDWGGLPKPECGYDNVGSISAQTNGHYFQTTTIYACVKGFDGQTGNHVYGWVPMASGDQLFE
ncbi:MAG: discoidin domain-containing protein [Fibrobacterales bacterium]